MRVTLASGDEWARLSREDETATIFQTPGWHDLAANFENTRCHPLLFDFGRIKAVLPLQVKRRWWGTLHTAPFGTYTALVCPWKLDGDKVGAISRELLRLNVEFPGSPFSRNSLSSAGGMLSQTRILRLEGLQFEDWIAGWSRNHRRCLRDAQASGFRVRLAETKGDIEAYYGLYCAQVERWGKKARRVYPLNLFQDLFFKFGLSGSLRLWIAEVRGKAVGGRLCLYHGFHAVEWHAAAEYSAMKLGVNHLLVHETVLHAQKAGFHVYDFNPNPELDSVDHFKRGFGTETVVFKGFRNRKGIGKSAAVLSNFRRSFFKKHP